MSVITFCGVTALVYMRSSYDDGHVEVRLMSSKTRVALIKKQSIPGLELLGANILARLVDNVPKSLPQEIETHYWVDSRVALCWIKNEKPWKQYIRNRVQEIRNLSVKEAWRLPWIPESRRFTVTRFNRERPCNKLNVVEWS